MSTPARAKHKINFDQKPRCKYKGMESIQKCDSYIFSDDVNKWMFSKYKKHQNFKSKF